MTRLKLTSPISGNVNEMDLPVEQEKIDQWYEMGRAPGAPLIQDFFSELNDEQREFILTGISPKEWNEYIRNNDDPECVFYQNPKLRNGG